MFKNDSHARMMRSQRRFFQLVIGLILAFMAAAICLMVYLGVALHKTAGDIGAVGVSGVIEKVWCGERKDCKVPWDSR